MKQSDSLNLNKVLNVALSTKNALFAEWSKCGEKFVDKNNMRSEGLIPQSIGVASTLLLLVAFGNDKTVFPAKEKEDVDKKVAKMVTDMLDMVDKEGYSITPYKRADQTKALFDTYGYTDVMTWVSSSCILARYAQRKGSIRLEDSVRDRLLHTGADAFKKLLEGQREDGTWGFRADAGNPSQGSLYFTYAVNAAIADFFNYALGEIDEVEKNNKAELLGGGRDDDFINYLNDKGGFDNVVESVTEARRKLQEWLIKNCLPLLPKVATCKPLTENDKKTLLIGNGNNSCSDSIKLNYFNLYHTYFLVDMFIDSAADKYYEETICNDDNKEKLNELKKFYDERIEKILNSSEEEGITQEDKDFQKSFQDEIYYYFTSGKKVRAKVQEGNEIKEILKDKYKDFCFDYMEQAIHTSRGVYMSATRTGGDFWEMGSEYALEFACEKGDLQRFIRDLKINNLTDPALVPLALRVNTQYSYYISDQPDKTVDDLFDKIINDRFDSANEEHASADGVHNLWDTENYNLLITERSIEALIDAYDYVCKYEEGKQSGATVSNEGGVVEEYIKKVVEGEVSQKLGKDTAVDNLQQTVESAVKKAVESLNINAVIEREVEKRLANVSVAPVSTSGGGISEEEFINKIKGVAKFIKDEIPGANGELPNEKLSYELLRLFMGMNDCMNRVTVAKQLFMANERRRDGNELFTLEDDRIFRKYTDDAIRVCESYEKAYPNFFNTLVDDINSQDQSYLLNLYGVLKDLLDQRK